MKHREFVYTGRPVPELAFKEHPAFFLNMYRAVLMSLEQKSLLDSTQRERCMEILERQSGQRSGGRELSDGGR